MADIPSQGQPISDFDAGTLTASSLFAMSYPRAATGMSTGKISAAAFGQGMGENVVFSGLNTADKTLFGAINELSEMMPQLYTQFQDTIQAGWSEISIFNYFFELNAMYDIYTDNPDLVIKTLLIREGHPNSVYMVFEEAPLVNTEILFVRKGYVVPPVPVYPHGLSPKDVISWTVPTGTPIKYVVLWAEPSNNNSGWLWAITECHDVDIGGDFWYDLDDNSSVEATAYSIWANGLLNKTISNSRNNPTALAAAAGPQSVSYSASAQRRIPIFNTIDITDAYGTLIYPANCSLADFGIEE